MAKVKSTVKCLEVNVKEQGSSVVFIIPKEKQTIPDKTEVKMIVQINYEGRDAAQFEPGKTYTVQIE